MSDASKRTQVVLSGIFYGAFIMGIFSAIYVIYGTLTPTPPLVDKILTLPLVLVGSIVFGVIWAGIFTLVVQLTLNIVASIRNAEP